MNRLKELRIQHKESQQDVADFLNLTQKAVSNYELGSRDIPNDTLIKLANHYGVSTDYILGIENNLEDNEIAKSLLKPLSAEEKKTAQLTRGMLDAYSKLSPHGKEKARDMIRLIAQDEEFNNMA